MQETGEEVVTNEDIFAWIGDLEQSGLQAQSVVRLGSATHIPRLS